MLVSILDGVVMMVLMINPIFEPRLGREEGGEFKFLRSVSNSLVSDRGNRNGNQF